MNYYAITIDMGTTNTRAFLIDLEAKIISRSFRNIGIRNSAIDGDSNKIKNAIREVINELLTETALSIHQLKYIIASGMITSNLGLVEVPHITAPVNADSIARHVQKVFLQEICDKPIWFIPGVKNSVDIGSNISKYKSMDIMRGEETETLAILNQVPEEFHIVALPGSHSKYVFINKKTEIIGCLTTMSGELLEVISKNTILANSVNRTFVSIDKLDKNFLIMGSQNTKEVGFSRACFLTRILDQFTNATYEQLASYLLGVCIQSDIEALKTSTVFSDDHDKAILISGKNILQAAMYILFNMDKCFKNILIFPEKDIPLSVLGAKIIAEKVLNMEKVE